MIIGIKNVKDSGGIILRINSELLKGSTQLLVLRLLEDRDMYGYEIIKEMDRLSKGLFQFKEGSLYPILHALENKKYIKSYWESNPGSRSRKYYQITTGGKAVLEEKIEEWNCFSAGVCSILSGGGVVE